MPCGGIARTWGTWGTWGTWKKLWQAANRSDTSGVSIFCATDISVEGQRSANWSWMWLGKIDHLTLDWEICIDLYRFVMDRWEFFRLSSAAQRPMLQGWTHARARLHAGSLQGTLNTLFITVWCFCDLKLILFDTTDTMVSGFSTLGTATPVVYLLKQMKEAWCCLMMFDRLIDISQRRSSWTLRSQAGSWTTKPSQ